MFMLMIGAACGAYAGAKPSPDCRECPLHVSYVPIKCVPVISIRGSAPTVMSQGKAPVIRNCGSAPVVRSRGEAPVVKSCGAASVVTQSVLPVPTVRSCGVAPVILGTCAKQ